MLKLLLIKMRPGVGAILHLLFRIYVVFNMFNMYIPVSGGRVRVRPRLGWMDGVKVALGNRGMTVEDARQCAKDRKEWRALVHM